MCKERGDDKFCYWFRSVSGEDTFNNIFHNHKTARMFRYAMLRRRVDKRKKNTAANRYVSLKTVHTHFSERLLNTDRIFSHFSDYKRSQIAIVVYFYYNPFGALRRNKQRL